MKETVIQFGEGNFLRGFFDYFLHNLNKKGLYEGKAVVVQPIPVGRAEELNGQDCRYNLYLRGIQKGEIIKEHTFVESISRCIDPYKSYEDYMALADSPDFRFIVSNTTEAGIEFVADCKFEDKPALSFPGKLTQLLYRRYKNGLRGFVILACELIDNNGSELKKCVMKYADLWNLGEDFKAWLNGLIPHVVYCDPSAASWKVLLMRHGYRVQNADNDVVNGIRHVAMQLNSGKYIIDKSCKNTEQEYSSYVWNQDAQRVGQDKPVKEHDHTCDTDRYVLYTESLTGLTGVY